MNFLASIVPDEKTTGISVFFYCLFVTFSVMASFSVIIILYIYVVDNTQYNMIYLYVKFCKLKSYILVHKIDYYYIIIFQ